MLRHVFPLVLLLLLPLIACCSVNPMVIQARQLYYQANNGDKYCKAFFDKMASADATGNAVVLCYKGVASVMRAKYSYNPFAKLSCFNQGKELIEQAVDTEPGNVEIRFLRFCVQSQAPGLLGYNGSIKADKQLILAKWTAVADADLKQKIKAYMLQYGHCDPADVAIFNK